MFNDWPHRTYCETLEECRSILKNINIWNYKRSASILRCIIEETQVYGNRMEAGLSYKRDIKELHEKRRTLNKEIKELELEIEIQKKVINHKEDKDADV